MSAEAGGPIAPATKARIIPQIYQARGGVGRMKVYEGRRTFDGLVVTVDGKKLDEHYEAKRFTRLGFEWTYEGGPPQQLALAILVDHLGDPGRAVALSETFMKNVVANLDNDWVLTSENIDAAIAGNWKP